jgi:hypothetical protein
MKIQAAVVCLLASGASAFSPKAIIRGKPGLIDPNNPLENNSNSPLWIPPGMKMVAGGAERSYGQEYYEGKNMPFLLSP